MGFFLSRRWKRQPRGPVEVDWNNPLTDGLVDAWIGSQPERTLVRRFATTPVYPRSPRQDALAAAIGPSLVGPFSLGPAAELLPDIQTATFAMVRHNDTLSVTNDVSFGFNGGADARVLAHAPYGDGSVYFDFGNATTGRASGALGGKLPVERWVFSAGLIGGRRVWRNGAFVAGNDTATAALTNTAFTFYVGGTDAAALDNFGLSLFLVLRREWGRWDAIAFGENPWQLFRPRTLRIYSLPPASGIPVLSLAGVNDITSTSARPKVTITF